MNYKVSLTSMFVVIKKKKGQPLQPQSLHRSVEHRGGVHVPLPRHHLQHPLHLLRACLHSRQQRLLCRDQQDVSVSILCPTLNRL